MAKEKKNESEVAIIRTIRQKITNEVNRRVTGTPERQMENMKKSLTITFNDIKSTLQLSAAINGISYADFAFTETTD